MRHYAGYDGSWWAANVLLHIPADSTITLAFGIVYEMYGTISAFSHAQLSIVGYSDKWYVTLRYAMLCYVVLCYAPLCYPMLC
jgi:hypothetical protein